MEGAFKRQPLHCTCTSTHWLSCIYIWMVILSLPTPAFKRPFSPFPPHNASGMKIQDLSGATCLLWHCTHPFSNWIVFLYVVFPIFNGWLNMVQTWLPFVASWIQCPPAIFFKALKSWEKWSSPPPPVNLYPLLEQKPSSKLQRLGWAVATVFSSCLKNIIPFLNCSLKLLPISTQTTHCYISIRKWWEAKIYYWCHILKGQHWDLRLHVGTCRNWT